MDSSHSYEEEVDGYQKRRNWHPGLPSAPEDFAAKASFKLTGEEACYLKERVLARWPNTMLACLLDSDMLSDSVPFPWDHPICPDLPDPIKEKIFHARNFSEAIYGAALLYNLMLAEKASSAVGPYNDGLVSQFKDKLKFWADSLQSRRAEFDGWDYKGRFGNRNRTGCASNGTDTEFRTRMAPDGSVAQPGSEDSRGRFCKNADSREGAATQGQSRKA